MRSQWLAVMGKLDDTKVFKSFCFPFQNLFCILRGKSFSIKHTNPKEKTFQDALEMGRAGSHGGKLPLPPKSLKSAPAPKPSCFHAVDECLENGEPPLVGLQAHTGGKKTVSICVSTSYLVWVVSISVFSTLTTHPCNPIAGKASGQVQVEQLKVQAQEIQAQQEGFLPSRLEKVQKG